MSFLGIKSLFWGELWVSLNFLVFFLHSYLLKPQFCKIYYLNSTLRSSGVLENFVKFD